jgi:hypothetical protein
MSHGTYTGYATYVSLTALYPSVTFTSTATIEADQGFAVVTGDQAGYSIFN